jgi:hypothetical protein
LVIPATFVVLLPIAFILFFYSMVGLYIFKGAFESRCREFESPEGDSWPILPKITSLCGPFDCPDG